MLPDRLHEEPLASLCAGIALIKLTETLSQKEDTDTPGCTPRGRRLLQAFALLNVYRETLVAKGGQRYEADYNMGRAAHQVGVLEIARRRYSAAIEGAATERRPELVELARAVSSAAGHNMAVLLRAGGAPGLAARAIEQASRRCARGDS